MILDAQWFRRHQRLLLWLCNTPLVRVWFRWVLRINGDRSDIGDYKIDRILPNGISHKRRDGLVWYEVRTHDKFSKRLFFAFYYLWYVIHIWDTLVANRLSPRLNLGFDTFPTEPLFPAADANSPVDGRVRRSGVDEVFGTIRAGAGTNAAVNDTATSSIGLIVSANTNQFADLFRSIYCFNTGAVLNGGKVLSGVFSLNGVTKGVVLGAFEADVVAATPAATNTLDATDYAQLGTTVFVSIASASLTTGDNYAGFTLDANGILNVSSTGISKFGLRINWDTDNSFGGAWTGSSASTWETSYADETGTSKDPKLTGTYTPSGVGFFAM